MAHLLIIESWLVASGLLLPKALQQGGHSYILLCRDAQQYAHSSLTGGLHPIAAGAQAVVECDTHDLTTLLAKVQQLHSESPFAGVTTNCDFYLRTVAEVARHLGLPGTSPQSIALANNKATMRDAMLRAGLPSPEFAFCTDVSAALEAAEFIGYPLIIKPTDLCSSLLVSQVNTPADLQAAWQAIVACERNGRGQPRASGALLEAYLDGPEFSVETITQDGLTEVVGITDKSIAGSPNFVESGHMFPAAISTHDYNAMAALVVQALHSVGYYQGVSHTEVKLTSLGPRVVEINTRVGGNWISELVRRVTGIDLFSVQIALALGQPWQPTRRSESEYRSAAIQFLLPTRSGTLAGITGLPDPSQHPEVLGCLVRPDLEGRQVVPAEHNDHYLGYIMCGDPQGLNARAYCQRWLDQTQLVYRAPKAS